MSIIGGTQINNNKGNVFNQVANSTIKIWTVVYNKNYNMYGVVTEIDFPNVYVDFVGHEKDFFLGQTHRVCRYTDLFTQI